jgi:hypothetical protein
MIFGQDCDSCDDFGDCHNEIAIVGVDFIGISLLRVIDLIVDGHEEIKV